MKQYITPESIFEELKDNPHKYPTKDDWVQYMSNLAYCKFDEAMLNKIASGKSIDGVDEAQAKFHSIMMDLGEKVWNIYNASV